MAKTNVSGKSRTAKAAVFNFSTPSARVAVGKAEAGKGEAKIIGWGDKDDLPHHYLRLIGASGTATSCLQILETFIIADGFRDKTAAKTDVNEFQTADSLLQDMAGDVASLNGIALRIRYSKGKILTENLPVECVRKLDSGEYVYNPTFGTKKVEKDKAETLTGYSNLEALKAYADEFPVEAEEKGQIYYYYYKTKGAYEYPKPPYATDGGLADIENDAEISLYDLDEVKSGFQLSAILKLIGDFEDTVDDNGTVIPNPRFESITETIKSFTERKSRAEARKRIMVLSAETKEGLPELEVVNNSKSLELLDSVTLRIANKVCRHMITPPPLAGLAMNTGWETQALVNQIQLFQMRILKYQSMIQRVMEELYPGPDWMISTLNPLKFIPSEVLAKMTDAEIRELGGLPPLETPLPSETEKTLNALNGLSPLVANKVLESMTETEIRALVALPPKTEPNGTPNN